MPPATEPPGHGVTGDAAASDDSYDVSVTYTDDGFDPRDLKVDKGTRVRFLNASGQSSFWPASGVHPTHTLYPEKEPADCLGSSFDACRELAPGEFYDFTFNYVGTWSFHDHLHAYHTGSITVSPPSTP
jgi:plastocyanin